MLEIDGGFATPNGFPKRRSRHERAGMVDQQRQDSKRLRCELEDLTVPHEDMIDRVEMELPETPYTVRITLLTEKLSESYSFSIEQRKGFATNSDHSVRD